MPEMLGGSRGGTTDEQPGLGGSRGDAMPELPGLTAKLLGGPGDGEPGRAHDTLGGGFTTRSVDLEDITGLAADEEKVVVVVVAGIRLCAASVVREEQLEHILSALATALCAGMASRSASSFACSSFSSSSSRDSLCFFLARTASSLACRAEISCHEEHAKACGSIRGSSKSRPACRSRMACCP